MAPTVIAAAPGVVAPLLEAPRGMDAATLVVSMPSDQQGCSQNCHLPVAAHHGALAGQASSNIDELLPAAATQ